MAQKMAQKALLSYKIHKDGSILSQMIRLRVYNFIGLEESIKTLSKLSKKEREALKLSGIARERKIFEL